MKKKTDNIIKDLENKIAQGNLEAMFDYAEIYQYNRQNEITDEIAAKMVNYYEICIEDGNLNAALNLGSMYYIGEIIPRDYKKAFKYYKLAKFQPMLGVAWVTAITTAGIFPLTTNRLLIAICTAYWKMMQIAFTKLAICTATGVSSKKTRSWRFHFTNAQKILFQNIIILIPMFADVWANVNSMDSARKKT